MKQYLQAIRNTIWYESWEKHKNRLSMEELTEVLNCNLKTLYRVLREQDKQRSAKIKNN